MDNNIIDKVIYVINYTPTSSKTIINSLFTDQLPATLTFIAALLGIVAQIYIGWKSAKDRHREEMRKYVMECIRNFYIPILNILLVYNENIKILKKIDGFNLFENNSSTLNNHQISLQKVYDSIKNISQMSLDKYYPINKKVDIETRNMLSFMVTANEIINLPTDEKEKMRIAMKIPQDGYDVETLIKLINKAISKSK